MRGLIRTGGGGAVPQTTDSAGNPAGNVVAEVTSMPAGPYVIEQGQFQAVRVTTGSAFIYAASNNTTPTGAIGDYLHAILFPRGLYYVAATPTTDHIGLYDSQSASPAGDVVAQFGPDDDGSISGAAAVGSLNLPAGSIVPVGMTSQTGGWCVKLFGSAPAEIVLIGRFTATAF